MKRKHIGLMVGTFFIVAFIAIIVATVIIAQKVMEDEKFKESYYATQYGINQENSSKANTPVKFPSQAHTAEPDSPQYKAIQLIRDLHAQADFFLLGSKFSKYSKGSEEGWSDILKSELLKPANYNQVIEAMPEEEDIVKDMNNLLALLDIATTQYEPDALRFMHRILHDLDLYGYPDESRNAYDYWGATNAVASSNSMQLDEINAYIAEKQAAE